VALARWPGAGDKGVRIGIITKRNKKIKVTLPPIRKDNPK
jgi:hypothetical protein